MPRHRTDATKSPPRIMIEVTEEQFNTFKRHLPYGFQKQVFKAIVQDMCEMWEKFGDEFTRAIITKNLTYKQFMDDHIERNYRALRREDYHGHTQGFAESAFPLAELGSATGTHETHPGLTESERTE